MANRRKTRSTKIVGSFCHEVVVKLKDKSTSWLTSDLDLAKQGDNDPAGRVLYMASR